MSGVAQRVAPPAPPEAAELSWRAAWPARVAVARTASILLVLLRLTLVSLAMWVVARAVLQPHNGWELAAAWVILSALGVLLFEATDRMLRRYLPLVALLHLDVAFPGAAPSRFRTALRSGSTRSLKRRKQWLAGGGGDLAPQQAASALLELVGALSAHDRATRGHSERVRAYTELLAEELGMSRVERHQLRWGGLVHDVGKLRIPASVLNKRSPLVADEWELIRRHPLEGLELAAPLRPWLGDAVLAVSDHHERWEGGGYPSGAAGTDIALSGRIVAVADAFDVMTSARSYKRPMPPAAAREELAACAGTQFDPEVVRAFLSISMPRLRRILGPLAGVQAAVPLMWHYHRFPMGRRLLGAVTITAVVYAGGAFGPPDAQARPRQPLGPSQGADVRTGAGPTSSTARDHRGNGTTAPAHKRPMIRHPAPSRPLTVVAPDTDVAVVISSDPQPEPAASPQPAPTPGVGSGGGLVIDPSSGTVTIVPPSFVPASVPPLVTVPVVGTVACGNLGVCTPIVIPLPPLPIFRLF